MNLNSLDKLADYIELSGQLAAALEVSGFPKPGNVHRTVDFLHTRFEHFIASSISLGPSIRKSALQGISFANGNIKLSQIGVGYLIKQAVINMKEWQRGGNTHLGVILLFIPIAATAGITFITDKTKNITDFRKMFREVIESTTPEDVVNVYDSIRLASPDGLGKVKNNIETLDLNNQKAEQEIFSKGLSLFDVMLISSKWDTISLELTNAMDITFNVGYPTLNKVFSETEDINVATVTTYLTLLSLYPDTFIARKVGLKYTQDIVKAFEIGKKKAEDVSQIALKVLNLGGLKTVKGKRALLNFDKDMRIMGEDLNPGVTADLTAASLMINLLFGLRF